MTDGAMNVFCGFILILIKGAEGVGRPISKIGWKYSCSFPLVGDYLLQHLLGFEFVYLGLYGLYLLFHFIVVAYRPDVPQVVQPEK